MQNPKLSAAVLLVVLAGSTIAFGDSTTTDLRPQVQAVEQAFAKTMADRDHEAFTSFLSQEAIFIAGPTTLRGGQEIAERWKVFFEGPEAPFSWEPETVEVLESGNLALSTGPVRNAEGKVVSTFTSVWRQEAPGVWRIVLDQGNPVCPPPEEVP